jgi:hypothetical protein
VHRHGHAQPGWCLADGGQVGAAGEHREQECRVLTASPDQSVRPTPTGVPTPGVGLMPTSPQAAAGIRTDPSASVPCATATRPAATAAPAPPDEPPAVSERFHGLRVTTTRPSGARPSVVGHRLASDAVVVPTTTAPAARSLSTSGWSASAGEEGSRQAATPATGTVSFTATGTPASGSRPRSSRPARSAASISASERRTVANAPRSPSSAAMRSRATRTASTEEDPARTPAAIMAAVGAAVIPSS